ncbi:rnhA operon protein [Halobacteriales archaeon QS_1_68_20]|nr:MAG: rnhA operon protein [Halobacteriales archaeon QS_1_68_20]
MAELPDDVRAKVERLTHRARRAGDEGTASAHRARRDELLAEYGYRARVRQEDAREVLVLYPDDWVEDGTVRTDRIEDTDRAAEIPLSGPGNPEDWDDVEAHNRDVVARVRDRHGDVHGDNAAAFADFMGNHYAKRVEEATPGEVGEFLAEYFPRNAWPGERQREVIEESVDLVRTAGEENSGN